MIVRAGEVPHRAGWETDSSTRVDGGSGWIDLRPQVLASTPSLRGIGIDIIGRCQDPATSSALGRGIRLMDGSQPERSDSFEVDDLSRVVAACDRFEAEWRGGGSPRIEA